jgi:hypothetical protein
MPNDLLLLVAWCQVSKLRKRARVFRVLRLAPLLTAFLEFLAKNLEVGPLDVFGVRHG